MDKIYKSKRRKEDLGVLIMKIHSVDIKISQLSYTKSLKNRKRDLK